MWLAIWKNNNNSFFDETRYLAKPGFFKTTRRSTVSDHFNFWQDIIKNTTELCDVKQSSLYQSSFACDRSIFLWPKCHKLILGTVLLYEQIPSNEDMVDWFISPSYLWLSLFCFPEKKAALLTPNLMFYRDKRNTYKCLFGKQKNMMLHFLFISRLTSNHTQINRKVLFFFYNRSRLLREVCIISTSVSNMTVLQSYKICHETGLSI